LQSPISLNILNSREDINLTSPVYFIHGGKWHVVPDKKIDAIGAMSNYLEFDSGQGILEGALVYKIQRKHAESGKFIQDKSKRIQLLVAWHVDRTKGSNVRTLLVEHDKGFNWNKDKLRRLYQKYWHPLDAGVDFVGSNWLLDNAAMSTATVYVSNGDYRWDIFIHKRKEVAIERPLWLDAERWVSMTLMIFLMLTCTFSLTLYMPMNVTIHNQHSGIELASPVCFYDGRIYNEYSVERVDDGEMMKIGIRFGLLDELSDGILMCEVKKKGNIESGHQSSTDIAFTEAVEDTSKITRLLVTWKIKNSGTYRARIILTEHDNKLVLNEVKPAQLYNNVNDIHTKIYNWIIKYDGIYKWTWLMRDNTVLEATDVMIFEKGIELKITVTEGAKDEDAESAFWIDSIR
jgi:hypothetical protein